MVNEGSVYVSFILCPLFHGAGILHFWGTRIQVLFLTFSLLPTLS